MAKPNIKPCPFCGEVLQLTKSDTWTHEAQSKGTCILATMAIPNDYEDAVKLWNTRADTVDAKLRAANTVSIYLTIMLEAYEGGQATTIDNAYRALQKWEEAQDE